jgi:glutamyl-tRNA reductase
MPEEPDVSPEELDVLDRVLRMQIEARKQERQREAEQIQSITDRIMQALQTRPEGMTWLEIRGMFNGEGDEQIRNALLCLMKTPQARNKVEKRGEQAGERFLLAAVHSS